MWEKIRVIFTIPELRQKILLTLLLLAIYRVGWQIPLPIVDHNKMTAFFSKAGQKGLGDLFNQVPMFSASQLNQATIFGLGIMPYISASIIFQLLGSVYPPLEKLQKEGESGRKKINEYTRYATVVLVHRPKLDLRGISRCSSDLIYEQFLVDGMLPFSLAVDRRDDDDRRHGLPDVAGRADRRIRHRQRHQPVDYGGHSRPHAPGRLRGPRSSRSSRTAWNWAAARRRRHRRRNAAGLGGVVRGRGVRRGADHPGPAPHSHAKRQARPRPAGLRRHAAVPAAAGQPGRRDAHHLRQQLAAVPLR